jgi:hypothetical protein
VEPRRDRVAAPDRPGRAGQDEERRLERVFGVVRVAEQAATDAKDHRPVPLDERGEGQFPRLARPGREAIEQLAVRQATDRADVEQRPEPCGGPTSSALCHDAISDLPV